MNDECHYTLVTGATSGIGLVIARKLAQRRKLILHGRDAEKLENLKQSLPAGNLIWKHDLIHVDSLQASLSEFLYKADIYVDGFVHSAGVLKLAPLRSRTYQLALATLNVNTLSAIEIIQTLANFRTNKSFLRSVCMISSNVSNFGAKAMSDYVASKAAVDAYVRSISLEARGKFRINAVCPGAVRTNMTKDIIESRSKVDQEPNSPFGLIHADHVAEAVEFLMSNQGSGITGHSLVVDGGHSIDLSL